MSAARAKLTVLRMPNVLTANVSATMDLNRKVQPVWTSMNADRTSVVSTRCASTHRDHSVVHVRLVSWDHRPRKNARFRATM